MEGLAACSGVGSRRKRGAKAASSLLAKAMGRTQRPAAEMGTLRGEAWKNVTGFSMCAMCSALRGEVEEIAGQNFDSRKARNRDANLIAVSI